MTTTHTNIAIVEGEVYILGNPSEVNISDWVYDENGIYRITTFHPDWVNGKFKNTCKILFSTNKSINVMQLDRKHFVKPKVDVEELADHYLVNVGSHDRPDITRHDFIQGYNAKEAEFTEQDLIDAMYSAKEYPNKRTPEATFSDFVNAYMDKLRPLSLPASITTDENYNVISVHW